MFTGGAVIGDESWMSKAIIGEKMGLYDALSSRAGNLEADGLNDVGNSFLFQMSHSVTEDGMWFEGSWGYHGHLDKLSFVFFAFGRELGVDPGRAKSQAYRLPIHRNWYKATIAHNTILVDFHSQKGVDGKLLGFTADDDFAILAVETTNAYPRVRHKRVFAQTPEYLLIFDSLASASPHAYTFIHHNRGSAAMCENAKLANSKGFKNPFPGSEYINNIKTSPLDDKGKSFVVTVSRAGGGTDVLESRENEALLKRNGTTVSKLSFQRSK